MQSQSRFTTTLNYELYVKSSRKIDFRALGIRESYPTAWELKIMRQTNSELADDNQDL